VEENLLKHIRDVDNPKTAWDIFVALFSRTNDAHLQHPENQLMNNKQEDMMISWYFMKIKYLCYEIAPLDPDSRIPEG